MTDVKISAVDTAARNENLLKGLEMNRGNRNTQSTDKC